MSLSALLPGTPVLHAGRRGIISTALSRDTGKVGFRAPGVDELEVGPLEVEVIPHWIVMVEVSGGVTGLRQRPLQEKNLVLCYEDEVAATQRAMDYAKDMLGKGSPGAKFRAWTVRRT